MYYDEDTRFSKYVSNVFFLIMSKCVFPDIPQNSIKTPNSSYFLKKKTPNSS